MDGRIVILSDLHFGRPRWLAPSADALRPLWQGADRLVINGDLAEVHHPRHAAAAARKTMRLFDLCETDGVALTVISGNHDPFISDLRHLHLADEAIFVTHGDVLHPAVAPWSPAAGRMRQAHEQAMASLEPEQREDLETRLAAAQRACAAEWVMLKEQAGRSSIRALLLRPWSLAQVLWYWHVVPVLAAGFAAVHAPRARFVVIGHTHRPSIRRVGRRTVINTGSFCLPGPARMVVVEDDQLSVWSVRRRGDVYRAGRRPVRRFDLGTDAESSSEVARSAA